MDNTLTKSKLIALLLVFLQLSKLGTALPTLSAAERNFLPDNGEPVVDDEKKRSAPLEDDQFDPDQQTVGDIIYRTYERLPSELYPWLFEMDIVRNSPVVDHVLQSSGISDTGPQEGHRERKTAGALNYLWPNGRVPFVFGSSVSKEGRNAAINGMREWMKYTCIQFVPIEDDDKDFVEFVEHDGCWSNVGKVGGVQLLSLGTGSNCKRLGVVLHELGHAMGLWHEQSRPDRNDFVDVIWDNIVLGARENFSRYSRRTVQTFKLPYDYGSIMHYSAYAFSRNKKPTLVPKMAGRLMGQRRSLSPLDIEVVNLLYSCHMDNGTREAVNLSDSIPTDAFLILNDETRTCLDVSNRTTDWNSPMLDQHVYTGLYYVSLTDCRSEDRNQFWKWTSDGSLLHLGTFLCLTSLNNEFIDTSSFVSDLLVLMHCRGDDNRQKWACAGDFVENPYVGKCIKATQKRKSRRDTADSESLLDELANELSQYGSGGSHSSNNYEETHLFPINLKQPTLSNHTTTASLALCEQTDVTQTWCSVYYFNNTLQVSPSLCANNNTESHSIPSCYVRDMSATAGIPQYYARWIGCDELGYYASGFYHTDQISGNGGTAVITGIECCACDSVFTGQPNNPSPIHNEQCVELEWWNWQGTLVDEGWFLCPRGTFLKSFLLTTRPHSLGHYIWRVRCCRPELSPLKYGHCYKDYGKKVATDTSVHRCSLKGYRVTGMYKRECDDDSQECVEEIMCCMSTGV